jgi:hypothetical protein
MLPGATNNVNSRTHLHKRGEVCAKRTGFILHGLLHRGEAALQLRVVRIELQAGLVGVVRPDKVALAVESGALAAPTLGPVRLNRRRLLGVREGIVPVLLRGVGGGAVAVEDVVLRLERNGLGEFVTGGGESHGQQTELCK